MKLKNHGRDQYPWKPSAVASPPHSPYGHKQLQPFILALSADKSTTIYLTPIFFVVTLMRTTSVAKIMIIRFNGLTISSVDHRH